MHLKAHTFSMPGGIHVRLIWLNAGAMGPCISPIAMKLRAKSAVVLREGAMPKSIAVPAIAAVSGISAQHWRVQTSEKNLRGESWGVALGPHRCTIGAAGT